MFNLVSPGDSLDNFLDNPEIDTETKLSRLRKEFEEMRFRQQYFDNPRDKYQGFLLQAKQVDCAVDKHILDEVERMKKELDR